MGEICIVFTGGRDVTKPGTFGLAQKLFYLPLPCEVGAECPVEEWIPATCPGCWICHVCGCLGHSGVLELGALKSHFKMFQSY